MSKNRSKDWKAARLHASTLRRLERVRKQLETGCEMGKRFIDVDVRNERFGMDKVVRALLTEWERHNERRRSHARSDEDEEGGG